MQVARSPFFICLRNDILDNFNTPKKYLNFDIVIMYRHRCTKLFVTVF